MRILFISPYFPSNVDQAVFGVHQRMGMFIEALKSMAHLDVLFYGEQRIELPDLIVPHPRLEERTFVLQPLAALAPEMQLPGSGRTVRERLLELR